VVGHPGGGGRNWGQREGGGGGGSGPRRISRVGMLWFGIDGCVHM